MLVFEIDTIFLRVFLSGGRVSVRARARGLETPSKERGERKGTRTLRLSLSLCSFDSVSLNLPLFSVSVSIFGLSLRLS